MKKMSPKLITFFMVALILFSTISHAAARPEPSFREVDPQRHKVVIGEQKGPKPDISIDIQMRRYTYIEKIPQRVEDEKAMEVDDSCDGIGEDECLMRRTLAAHTDYLYTQEKKN